MIRLIIILLLAGCGDYRPLIYYETEEIKSIVEKFKLDHQYYTGQALKINNLNVTIREIDSSEVKGTVLGYCKKEAFKTPKIILNKLYWKNMNEWYKKQLLYHELGHCILNLKHSHDGLMQPYIIYWKEYKYYEDYYLNRLFNYGE